VTKRRAELIEELIRSMTARECELSIGWLSHGAEGNLWQWLKPTKQQTKEQD
jgi:hypothetical protein